MQVKKFQKGLDENAWNEFLKHSKNSTFLFDRNFMDYHKDRFNDHSLMVYDEKENLIACFPANENYENEEIISHQGLTYGGVIVDKEIKMPVFLNVFKNILKYYHNNGYSTITFKKFPDFYNSLPSNEIDYAFFITDAILIRRDTAIAINQESRLKIQTRRKRSVKKALKLNIEVKWEKNIVNFYNNILKPNLNERFGVDPVHSLAEIEMLIDRFPDNILQYSAYLDDKIMAGCTLFVSDKVAHAQYISASEEGRNNGSLDYLFMELIDNYFSNKQIFDFGICNENQGRKINMGLLNWKESFGGRAYSHDFYQIKTSKYIEIDNVAINE